MDEHVISTHVLDTVHGGAAVGVKVSLLKRIDNEKWEHINNCLTGEDGRATTFITRNKFTEGVYKFVFNIGEYYESKRTYCIFPIAEVIFKCESAVEKYHIPMLVSSYSYTTYRGK